MAPSSQSGAIMPNLSIKDVPEAWAEALRQRASRSHRSLQGELMAIIERALQEELTAAAGVVGFDRFGHPITRRGTRTIEEIAAESRQRFPEPIRGVPLAVDIISADRDSR
jgi:plasmid stability protein